jgi:hypothetical protein
MKNHQMPNPVLPGKHYAIFNADFQIGHVTATDVHDAFRQGRVEFGQRCTVAILITEEAVRLEPMFV